MGFLRTLWSPKWRWLTLTGMWLFAAALGFWGLSVGKPQSTVWDRFYAVPDFFGLTIADDTARLDWRIQTARFLAPLAFATTFYAASAAVLRSQIDRLQLRFAKDHVVVAGLGDKGSRLASSFVADGRRVVAIEPDPANPFRATVVRQGVTVLTGQASDPTVLHEAGLSRAADLIACADDATNAEIVAVIRRLDRDPARPALRASIHLNDPHLSRLLGTSELDAARDASARFDYFNIFQRGARLWLGEVDPFDTQGEGREPHVVVVGVGPLGEAMAVAVTQRWAERVGPKGEPLRLTLVDPDAAARFRSLRFRHPALVAYTRAEAIDLDPDRPVPDAAEAFRSLLAEGSVTAVYVCDEDDTSALSTALTVRNALGSTPAQVTVRTRSADGLALLVDAEGPGGAVGITGFSFLDRTCSAEAIDGGTNEAVARALHDDHLARARGEDRTGPTVVPWDELTEDTRESNRRAADAMVASLAGVGCGLAPLFGWDASGFALDDEEVEQLARAEHDRWSQERRRAGWTHAPERDDVRKHHPLLVGWAELPEADRAQNRAAVSDLPLVLARAGFELVHLTRR